MIRYPVATWSYDTMFVQLNRLQIYPGQYNPNEALWPTNTLRLILRLMQTGDVEARFPDVMFFASLI